MLGNGLKVIQLETAAGAAMKNFEEAHGMFGTVKMSSCIQRQTDRTGTGHDRIVN